MNNGPVLQSGADGNDVKRLQRLLVMMKLLIDGTDVDSAFGPRTKQAVEDVQASEGLVVDGIVGAATWAALPADPNTPLLKRGSHGVPVTGVQNALSAVHDVGPIDGDFGPKTEAAVRAYQVARGVSADGIVGDVTWWTPAGAAGATLASLAGLTTI